ncbi:MBL fold metallo-hydrolase [Paenibacillus sp. SI8]|uniref:MBL fold metallo-hydrolase n=1 Tax=unclassified Paenibacillus TaxID=185978 RepID=UPI003466FD8D
MHRTIVSLFMVLLVASILFLQACSNGTTPAGKAPEVTQAAQATPVSTSEPSPAPSKSPKQDTETLQNNTGKTLIKSVTEEKGGNHMSFAIVSKQGTVIVADPHEMPVTKGVLHADIITSSFINHSHQDPVFVKYNPEAKVSEMKAERFTVKDVKVIGVAASQSTAPIQPAAPTNVIYVYEVDDLRIAYIGGLGQDELTKEQLDQLGKIDILLTYFNDAPTWNIKKATSIRAVQQIKPRIVLPTEFKPEIVDEMLTALQIEDRSETDKLVIAKSDVESIQKTKYVFIK